MRPDWRSEGLAGPCRAGPGMDMEMKKGAPEGAPFHVSTAPALCGEAPQHILQDAAIGVVVEFILRVDAAEEVDRLL